MNIPESRTKGTIVTRQKMIVVLVLIGILYILSYCIWVPIALHRTRQLGFDGYYFMNPRTTHNQNVHKACFWFYRPLIWVEEQLDTDRQPARAFPDYGPLPSWYPPDEDDQ